jgi:hypothetical protein
MTNRTKLKSLNRVTEAAGAVTVPLISIPDSPPLELVDDALELELELEDALLLDEEELELLEESPGTTPLDAELVDELALLEPPEEELELPTKPLELLEELLETAPPPVELDDEFEPDELLELDDELEPLPGASRLLESELLQPTNIALTHNATISF